MPVAIPESDGIGDALMDCEDDKATLPRLVRYQPELIRRTDGIKRILGSNVELAFAHCGGCVDVGFEVIDRQNFPIAGSAQNDHLAMLTRDIYFSVNADR